MVWSPRHLILQQGINALMEVPRVAVEPLIKKLKTYEIASADGTAIAAANVLKEFTMQVKVNSTKALLKEIKVATNKLREARQSSAALHNCLDYLEGAAQHASDHKVLLDDARALIRNASDEFIDRIDAAKRRIAEVGAKRI